MLTAVAAAFADTVWLDEPGIWERMSGGHGRSLVCTNGNDMVGGRYRRGVGTCAPSALRQVRRLATGAPGRRATAKLEAQIRV